jgi:hypothetical protein
MSTSNTDPQTTIKTQISEYLEKFLSVINKDKQASNLNAPQYVNNPNVSAKANNILKLYYIIINGGTVDGMHITGFLELKASILEILGQPADDSSIAKNYIDISKNNLK